MEGPMKTLIRTARLASMCLLLATPLVAAQARPQDQPPRPQEPVTRPQPPTGAKTGQDQPSTAKAGGVSASDQAFARKAAEGGMKEVALAKLAQQKASNDQVKSYAQRLERDHAQANDELKAWAAQKNVTLPSEAMGKDNKLESLQGAAFDKAYIAAMVADHKKDIAAFEKQASRGTDPDLKALVQKTLPTLKEHLKLAEETRTALGSPKTSS
jgi:putative membrane protein